MLKHYVTFLKYILFNTNFNLNTFDKKTNTILLNINKKYLLYTIFHFRLSSLLYSYQLIDMFSYEVPNDKLMNHLNFPYKNNLHNDIVVYNLFNLKDCNRILILTSTHPIENLSHFIIKTIKYSHTSISNIFFSANWLEREISELNSVNFHGKLDIRNLMLQYGDSTAPFKKSFPSIGLKEFYYSPISESVVQSDVSLNL